MDWGCMGCGCGEEEKGVWGRNMAGPNLSWLFNTVLKVAAALEAIYPGILGRGIKWFYCMNWFAAFLRVQSQSRDSLVVIWSHTCAYFLVALFWACRFGAKLRVPVFIDIPASESILLGMQSMAFRARNTASSSGCSVCRIQFELCAFWIELGALSDKSCDSLCLKCETSAWWGSELQYGTWKFGFGVLDSL